MFRLEIKTDNAAFEGNSYHLEIARILGKVAKNLEDGKVNSLLFDENGNRVGESWDDTDEGQ